MGRAQPFHYCILIAYLLTLFCGKTSQDTRNKRQIQPELPRILTQNGHLVFQTGTNHNITLRATNGGYININDDNLAVITQTVKDNKLAIEQLKSGSGPGSSGSTSVESRLQNLQSQLSNLQPTGQVQTQLLQLSHNIELLRVTLPTNVAARLSQIEATLTGLQSPGQISSLISALTARVATLESQGSESSSSSRRIQQLTGRVRQLKTQVETLQQLLTTNECISNPCTNGGTCVDTYNGYFCRCPSNFQGPNCNEDVNECVTYEGTDLGCQNGATCVNTFGGFTCQCTANYYGIRCTETHDDCTGASNAQLCGHGTCVNLQRVQPGTPKYTCICEDGWTKAGSDPACTVDVNECAGSRYPCSSDPLVPCINLPGSFMCGQCPTGYQGNGFTCMDVNECEVNNGGCSLSPMVQCINTVGSRSCGPCPSGYQGNGQTCTWVGICQNNNGGCHAQAACTESPGLEGRTCTCPPGYVGNGVGSSGCVSQGPVTGPCGSSPCRNGAACQNMGATLYRCLCQQGYTGQTCETDINECGSSPCQNGGSCTDRLNGYVCRCTEAYTGSNCEVQQQVCGGRLSGESGSFRFPTVAGTQYPHDVSCAWIITTTYNKIIKVTFPTFNIEEHNSCNYDHLQLNDGPSAASHVLGKFCGSVAPNNGYPINSTQHQMYVWFYSDQSQASDGFSLQWTSADPVCGGVLSGSNHGDFSSPGYPGNYPHDRDCVWLVSVSPGNRIIFSFATLQMEVHPNCSYDYLEIRDGGLDTSPLLQRFCNTTTPPPLSTSGPNAWVKFHSDSTYSDNGFHITYLSQPMDAGCGGAYTSESGVLQSPNYPNAYNHDAQCVWTVTVNHVDRITLRFTNLELEGQINCQHDYVEVRAGNTVSAPLMGRYCGNSLPAPMTTSGNMLYVKFVSDSSVTRAGFRATWDVSCGGLFTSPTGILRSPNYPLSYPSNRQCEYLINLPEGNRITLTFTAFDIEEPNGESCNFDYIEVRDGGTATSPLLGTYCGLSIPNPVSTTSNMLYAKFVTDGSNENLGFEARYEALEGTCGGQLTANTGSIQSPGHPNVYPHGVNCTWNIIVTPGLVIRLTFHTFSMEDHVNCRYDAVTVYDNSTAVNSSRIGRYCGSNIPPVITSTNNELTVLFESDSSVSHEGFAASYVGLNASTLCGSDLSDATGVITSPNFPDGYPHERQCTWTITAPDGYQILLNVTDFNLENHPLCNFDYLEIRNGGFPSSPLVGKYCGTTIDRIIVSHSNRMYIKLRTDNSRSAPGFRIFYDSTATGCGADLTTPTGSFISPNYPNPYGHNAECIFTITVSLGSTILLTFVDLDLELHANCSYDYVEVRDSNAHGPLLGRFCGRTIPDMVTSKGNSLWILYNTDYSVGGRGFLAHYVSSCSNNQTAYSGVIESPNFPNAYPHNRNCTWIINAALGNSVNISFSHFDVETHRNCTYDYLKINDGNLPTSPTLGRFCGTNIPPPVASTQDKVWINFKSDYSMARNGFRLEYVTNGCGGYFRTPTGYFTSPNFPNPYPHMRQCEWTIVADTDSFVQLTIHTFDLESHSSCRYDVLEVYGGPDDSSPQLAKLCHKQSTAQTLASTGNVMFVRFKSDVSRSGNGFNASYKTNTGGCGGNYTMKSGSIVSKNYPGPYPPNTDCEWLIMVEDRHVVELTFTDFDVETAENCTFDYVAVYDGTSTAAPELLRHCGNSLPLPSKYRSHGNSMYIRMRTDGTVSHRGFKADYVTGCGGIISETSDGVLEGDLVSPGYPGNYPRSSNCSWLIQAAHSTDRVTLTFTHMDTENSRNCSSDYILVRDGIDEGARVIGQFCGRTTPPAITSQGSALFLTFLSDYSNENSGFRATYTKSTSACGGDLTSQSGSFVSPGYPNSYPSNTECVWTVAVSPGNRVQLAFSVFNLEDHEYCNLDYVEIHEGQLGGPLLGRFCGENRPTNLTAYNGLWIKFRSDESASALGFVVQFAAVYGGEITGTSGQLASPNYPYTYPHRAHYMWTVTVPIGMQIRVSFVAMDMESFSRGCLFDFVKLRDGGTINSPLLGAYCGTTIPPVVLTTTNQLHVEFQSDWSSSGSGFLFDWTATTDMPTTTLPPTAGTTPVPGCGGTLNVTEATQSLSSPGWPYGYLNNLRCSWLLVAPVGSRVWMNITDMDIESSPTCAFDNITINRYGFRGILPAFCGRTRNTEPIVSVSNLAQVSFKTDGSFNRTGFIMDYKLICGGSIVADSGNVASPHFPGNYPANSNCSWRLTVPAGRTVRVTFNPNFNIQGNPGSCAGDYVQLLNGGSATSPVLGNSSGKYCGTSAPAIMETSSNNLFVNFISDGSGSGVGFSLAFNEVHVTCGGQLSLSATRTSGMFTSPNYPQLYPQNVDCIWVISAPANERIQMDFIEDFSIETHREYDFIELRDGGTVNSALLGSFCGNSLPSTVLSTGNVMYARFRTDNSIARKGFKALYKIATCGGSYSGSSGVITSPNYPANYESNLDCVWIIRGPTGHSLTFTFEAFALEASQNCTSDDYLEIREVNSTGPVLILACGFSIPQPVFTSDNFAYVRFVSSGTVQYPGFRMKFEASVEECGGDLMLPSGSFQSPNFPGNYPHSRLCEWKISVQMGRRVAITFNPFNIEDHSRCSYDYVAIYNGIYPDSPLINRFCGGSPPDVVKTSGNTARVQFRTDGSNSNRGFQAFYSSLEEAECGGLITTSSGNITSPGYGFGNYSNRLDCQWVLRNEQSAENTSIFIRIADIGLERHTYCQYDYLQAREGDSIDGVLLDQYCGNDSEIHRPIISPMPAVWLRFKTDASIVDKGFLLTYNFTQCGGVLTDPYGIITSPNYPQDYDHDDACAWVINAPEGSRINVELTDFAMETHPQCLFDYLELFNGPYASSPSIGKFCGTVPPRGFKSQSNSVRIVFFTDFSMSARGFRLTYSFSTQGCGGLLHTSTGNLSTPNYPSSYPHNTECVWDLNVDPGYILTLTFNPPFDMEHQGDCDYDYVEVSDVISNGSEVVLGRWCSNLLPPPQVSSGPRLMVRFRSDTSTNGNGFSASWKSMCGGRLSMQSSFLTSPGFPRPYPNNLRCNYTLDMDPQRYTFINFDANNFDIEAGGRLGCIYDFIAVYEGNSSNGRMLGKFCGSTAPQPVSALGPMYVQFWTDRSRAGRGFRAQYHSSECGGVLTEPAGVVRTPTGPANYHNEMNCTWFITVQADRVIQFRFRALDLEAHSSCDYDYIDVFDGPNIYSPLIGRYCGNVIPTDLIGSTSNAMTLNFVSDTSWTGKGFAGVYRMTFGSDQGCGGLLNATRGQLWSVDGNGDGLYEAFLDCRWLIMGANNKVIRLNIMPGFNLENHTDCVYDYLKIYDGMTIDDPLIGTYCGLSYPSEIVSTSNVLLVQFYSDGSMEGPGFNATYTQQDALCGGAFTSSSVPQVITSPGFPSAFRRDVRCRWTIDAPMATDQVEVMVTALNLQSSSACDTEYLELRDYPLGLQGRSVHTCGVTPPPVFDSVGRTIQINYAATAGSSKGFSLTYATANCNRTYGGNSGQIFSPGWPGRYPINANCSFNLTTPAGTMVSLYFNAFQLEPHRSCEYDYLEIVNSTYTSVYAKLCGWSLPDPVFVPSNIVRFRFVTDSSVTHPGYDITYTATSQGLGCGGNITGINGSFTSPGYPGNYSEASTCTWLVRVPARRVIVFTFTDMRMLDTVNCATDYVIVFDGDSDTADQFGRFCGDEVPVAMTTRTNAAFVKYVSNGQRAALAFRARFTS